MDDDRRAILEMLAEGKVSVAEAERLLAALGSAGSGFAGRRDEPAPRSRAKYLRVVVDTDEPGDGPTKVNIRVPLNLLRAGVRLSSVIPPHARDKVNRAMREHGVDLDLNQLRPENLEDLVEQLGDLTIDVDQDRTKVRIFAE